MKVRFKKQVVAGNVTYRKGALVTIDNDSARRLEREGTVEILQDQDEGLRIQGKKLRKEEAASKSAAPVNRPNPEGKK